MPENQYLSSWEREIKRKAEEEFSSAEFDRMRSMLDNPDVSPQNRQNFLYALSNADRLSDEEIDRYAAQFGVDADDVRSGGAAPKENLDNARASLATAKDDIYRAGAERTEHAIIDAQNLLQSGDFSTSDQIVDEVERVLDFFEEFYSRYQQARDIVGAEGMEQAPQRSVVPLGAGVGEAATYTHTGVDPASLRAGIDEFRGIDFSAFRADADMLATVRDSVAEVNGTLDSTWESNTGDWTGGAKDAAQQRQKHLAEGGERLSEALQSAGEAITHTANQAIQPSVVNLVQKLLGLYGDGTMTQLSPPALDELIAERHGLPALQEQARQMVQNAPGSYAQSYLTEWKASLDERLPELDKQLADFCSEYQSKANSVHEQAAQYLGEIDQHYTTLTTHLGEKLAEDPFAAAAGATGIPDVPAVGQPGGMAGTGGVSGAAGAGPGAAGAGMGGVGASMPSGPAGSVPDPNALMPDAEKLTPDELTPDGQAADGVDRPTNPVTGEPAALDPRTGEPLPIDPETGEVVGQDAREAFTVEHGERTLTMREPDHSGEMGISVTHGGGELNEYTLDFGADGDGGGTAAEQGGATDVVPGGATGAGGGEAAASVYRPGADGTIRIEDGDLTITAERPAGPEGPTLVTVDDGGGEPTSYTLGAERTGAPIAAAGGVHDGAIAGALPEEQGVAGESTGGAGGGSAGDPRPTSAAGGIDVESAAPVAGEPLSATQDDDAVMPGSDSSGDTGSAEAAAAPAVESDPDGAEVDTSTTPQSVEGGAGGSPFGGGGGGGGAPYGPETSSETGSAPSGAGLGTAPGGTSDAPTPTQGSGGSASGMGMMGGMGGAGGGQGGDQERSSNAYRIDGDIFDFVNTGIRISGTIGDTADASVRFTR